MIEIIVAALVCTACLCILILFAATVRVALASTLRDDKKKIAALADHARLGRGLPVDVDLKLQEISAIAKGDEFKPEIPQSTPQPFPRSTWTPPQ